MTAKESLDKNAKEALEHLVKDVLDEQHYYKQFSSSYPIVMKDKETIETAFSRLEKLEKVLQIIKEKRVDIDILISSDILITYNDFNRHVIDLTETEFNLLKEYLK